MRRQSFQQFVIVSSDSAQLLTERLNEKLYELRDKRPEVTFEGMIARISYQESTEEPESLGDEYATKGVKLSCGACPWFEPVRKTDGSIDQRVKWGDCPRAHYGRTTCESAACEKLFEALNNGEVKLCIAD